MPVAFNRTYPNEVIDLQIVIVILMDQLDEPVYLNGSLLSMKGNLIQTEWAFHQSQSFSCLETHRAKHYFLENLL